MATTTMVTVNNILKEVYEDGGINDQLQSEITALKRIETSSEGIEHRVGGKYVAFPIRTKRNHGIGARNENEALPAAQTQSYEAAQVKLKYLYGSLEMTGQTLSLANTNYQAFASALDQEVNGLREGLRKDLARQVYGDGSGKMATTNAAGTAGPPGTLVLSNQQAQYLEIGMVIDVYTAANALVTAGAIISNIQPDTPAAGTTTVSTVGALGVTAAGAYVTRAGNLNKEITGFAKIIAATGSLYNIDPALVPVWKAYVDSNLGVNRALTEGLMITVVDKIRQLGGGVPTVGFASLGVRRSYFNLLVQQRRMTDTKKFEGGFSGLTFTVGMNEIPIVEDVDAPYNKLQFVNEKEIKLYEAADWSFMDEDGSRWQRVITAAGTFDAYSATLRKYMEMGTHRRNAHAAINDITEG